MVCAQAELVTSGAVAVGMVCRREVLEVVITSTAIEAVAGEVAREKPWLTLRPVAFNIISKCLEAALLSISCAEVCSCTKPTLLMPSQECGFVDMFCA